MVSPEQGLLLPEIEVMATGGAIAVRITVRAPLMPHGEVSDLTTTVSRTKPVCKLTTIAVSFTPLAFKWVMVAFEPVRNDQS